MAEDIAWPVPERLPFGPMMSFGFTGEVLLPVRVTPPGDLRVGDRVELRAHAAWLVCAAECIPEEGPVSLALPVVVGPASPFARITRAGTMREGFFIGAPFSDRQANSATSAMTMSVNLTLHAGAPAAHREYV